MKKISKSQRDKIDLLAGIAVPMSRALGQSHRRGVSTIFDNGKYFNYINTVELSIILEILLATETKSFCDLGCGFPVIGDCFKLLNPKAQVAGYEIQRDILQIVGSSRFASRVEEKNILDMIGKDFEKFDHFYYWRPIANEELLETFVKRIIMFTKKGQMVSFRWDGTSGQIFGNSKLFKRIDPIERENPNILTYQRIK